MLVGNGGVAVFGRKEVLIVRRWGTVVDVRSDCGGHQRAVVMAMAPAMKGWSENWRSSLEAIGMEEEKT